MRSVNVQFFTLDVYISLEKNSHLIFLLTCCTVVVHNQEYAVRYLALVIMPTMYTTRHYSVHPLWGGHIIFAFSGVRRPTWFPDILGNSSYAIFIKFGMQVYSVNSLYGIAFGDDSSIAN